MVQVLQEINTSAELSKPYLLTQAGRAVRASFETQLAGQILLGAGYFYAQKLQAQSRLLHVSENCPLDQLLDTWARRHFMSGCRSVYPLEYQITRLH